MENFNLQLGILYKNLPHDNIFKINVKIVWQFFEKAVTLERLLRGWR